METIGEVKNIKSEYEMEWKILNFSSLSEKNYSSYCSPTFSFCNESWYLKMYPNGYSKTTSGYVSLFLAKKSSGPPIKVKYSLGLKTVSGQKDSEKHCEHIFKKSEDDWGYSSYILRSELYEKKADLLPADVITVFCPLKFTSLATSDESSLSEDFKKMLHDGINHDIILKVGDKEIRAHKDVLRARSQVFKSMLELDMKEKNTGVIDVPDCDPQAMEVFLSYVYSGKAAALHQDNMLQLYYIADKYEMIGLKNECCSFIKQFLSPTNFSDVIQLAVNHNDTSLFDFATEYFNNNGLDILQTEEWQYFLKDNSTIANKLLINSYKIKK